jgi:hypothetical protein
MRLAYYGDIISISPSVAQRHHSTYAPSKRLHILRASEDILTQVPMPRHIHRPVHALNLRYQSIEST